MEPKPRHPILNYDFLSLREHVEDVVISNVLMLALLAVGVWSHRRRKHDELKMVDKRAPLSLFEKVLVVTLGVSFFLNLFYKAGLGTLPSVVFSVSFVDS
jgi:hypothetical protein